MRGVCAAGEEALSSTSGAWTQHLDICEGCWAAAAEAHARGLRIPAPVVTRPDAWASEHDNACTPERPNRVTCCAPSDPGGLTFTAYGTPVPQGSTRSFVVKGKAITTSANANLRPWRDTMASAAREAMQEHGAAWDGPVAVEAVFTLARPKSRPKRDRYPDRRPDLDKLARGLLDALTGPMLGDDAQVCALSVVKRYAGDAPVALAEPGVTVRVRRCS